MWNLFNPSKATTFWQGSVGVSPTTRELEELLPAVCDDITLTDWTCQIIRNGDARTLSDVLNCLSCNFWRPHGVLDGQKILSLPNANNRTVCGMLFRKGLVVWTCRQCGKDPSCVQCDECFRNSNHEGHEVYFHRSAGPGGCCDCGDPEAWAESGNCCKHGCKEAVTNQDPLSVIPPELLRGLKAVLRGVIGYIISYVVNTSRSFHKWKNNIYLDTMIWPNEKLLLRLNNDDVHTYDEVTAALMVVGIAQERAAELTIAVDKDGLAVVKVGAADTLQATYYHICERYGLVTSIIPERIAASDAKVESLFNWLTSLGTANDGLKRAVTNSLLSAVNELPSCSSILSEPTHLDPHLSFGDATQFPSKIPLIPEDIPGVTDMGAIKNPFNYSPRNALSLIIMSTPYLTKNVKRCFNDMVILFQHDDCFKSSFSLSLTLLYPSLNALFCVAIGTAEDTIFNTTVQV